MPLRIRSHIKYEKKDAGQRAALTRREAVEPKKVRQRAPRAWSPEQDAFVIANFGTMTARQIGIEIGKSKGSVWQRAYKFGLAKNALMSMKQRARRQAERAAA